MRDAEDEGMDVGSGKPALVPGMVRVPVESVLAAVVRVQAGITTCLWRGCGLETLRVTAIILFFSFAFYFYFLFFFVLYSIILFCFGAMNLFKVFSRIDIKREENAVCVRLQ